MKFRFSISFLKPFAAGLLVSALSACMHEKEEDEDVVVKDTMAVISTELRDFNAPEGGHTVITVDEDLTASTDLLKGSSSDLRIVTNGDYFYRINRTHGSILKVSAATPDEAVDEYSVNGDDASANPHDLVFADNNKAYVLRWNTSSIWELDLSLSSDEDFKVDEIDLSKYADSDGAANPESGIVIGNRLFLLLQNIDYNNDYNPATAYLVVIDTGTNEEMDTDASLDGIQAITLPLTNPSKMIYVESLDKIFIQASGDTYPTNDYAGGIATVDINSYNTEILIDDSETTHSIANMAIVSETVGYFVAYKGWQDNYLFQFNPTTGEVEANSISALDGKDIADIEVDVDGKLWIASFSEAGIYILDPANNEIEGSIISTGLNPSDIEFISLP